ncbi:hypothetical protein OS493_019588 [Desmophyllum pertusum]|uniref:Uncharacterized protein n=1 Tax=Desmophyllum pertusum TaxID=174260 RepID=A0A9X0CWT9_9CNID|nr:hypothetical protein OS493_019588 [Desmophyllum pertusum]
MMRRTNFPCRQLNSEKIKGATLCYLSPIIVNKCSVVSAKCVCNIDSGLQRAWDEVCKTRDTCDKALQGIKSVAFFFSAISTQGPKKQPSKKGGGGNDEHVHGAESGDDDLITPSQVSSSASQTWVSEHPSIINGKLRPSLSYWVAVTTPNGAPANPITFHRALLECGVEATANQILCQEGKELLAMKELFKVLKDHSNRFMQELVSTSYQHCFVSEVENVFEDPGFIDAEECGTENVVRVRLVHASFKSILSEAVAKMQGAKLIIDRFGLDATTPNTPLPGQQSNEGEPRLGDKMTVLINDISIAMKRLDYALYRDTIYKKCDGASYTYSYKCDVKVFVNSLAANESFKARLIKEMKRIIDLLGDPDCEVIRPIMVDYNLIEVNGGYCWSVEKRQFLRDAIPAEKVGLVTPRAFSRYDPSKDPQPQYFQEILQNSLTDFETGLFCEDFLRLLDCNKKRHKQKVPCLVGDADSGKTSLFYPMLGLIHHSNVATVTKQKVFNKAMITKHTEVIFIDEASPSILDVDDWKILTQGGFTACDVKYKTARSFFNRCPMIMTAQQKLTFRAEDQLAMDRRLKYYVFKSLPNPKKKAAQWLRKHPMECIAWAASKARVSSDDEESSDETDEEERATQK